MRFRSRLAAAGLLVGALSCSVAPPVAAGIDCSRPTVQALIEVESAVSRPVIASPSEYALSNVYSLVEQATKPQFAYAEAGPQYAGAFEALFPTGTPPLVRSVAAYPSADIPDDDTAEWGGASHSAVTPISAAAASVGLKDLGIGGATSSGARSWATSIVECDVVTVVAGWRVSDAVLAPGVTVEAIGEQITLVVGPRGASAKSDVTLVGVKGAQVVPVAGRPTDPFTDPIHEGGGPRIDVGEPRTRADLGGATASGGGFNLLQTDPSTGQGAGYRLGSLNASIKVLGSLGRVASPSSVANPGRSETSSSSSGQRGNAAAASIVGSPPSPSPQAVRAARQVVTDSLISSVRVTTRSWFGVYAALALLLIAGATALSSRAWRRWFPTLDWIVRRGDQLRSRFSMVYLRW